MQVFGIHGVFASAAKVASRCRPEDGGNRKRKHARRARVSLAYVHGRVAEYNLRLEAAAS